jgi:hypothetical protein
VAANEPRAPVTAAAPPSARRTESRPTTTARAPTTRPSSPPPARSSNTRNAQPDTLCGTRTQFAYLYCMQEQCARAINRNNAQCAALRRSGDVR